MAAITARWQSLLGTGLDHVTLTEQNGTLVARGSCIGDRGGVPYGVFYRIDCDEAGHVRELAMGTTSAQGLHLISDGAGHWTNGVGEALAHFDGCMDVDLSGTPFTNSLPIRRLDWDIGQRRELRMVYVPFDTFVPVLDTQIYTCLAADRFLYEAADRSFSAEILVDAQGLVTEYPSLFTRIL